MTIDFFKIDRWIFVTASNNTNKNNMLYCSKFLKKQKKNYKKKFS